MSNGKSKLNPLGIKELQVRWIFFIPAWAAILFCVGCVTTTAKQGLGPAQVGSESSQGPEEQRPAKQAGETLTYFSGKGELVEFDFRYQSPEPFSDSQFYFDGPFPNRPFPDLDPVAAQPFHRHLGSQLEPALRELTSDLRQDMEHFYSKENIPVFLVAGGVGAVLANTQMDQDILEHVQANITFHQSDELQEFVTEYRFFGEGYFLLPVYAGTAVLGKYLLDEHPRAQFVGEWGDRCVRGILVGTPPLLISQYMVGASRPQESAAGSQWQFWQDNNGVSGHAFMGAIPFLTASQMVEDPGLKAFCIALSTLPALSRITENGHYPSQALMGWALAYAATSSISRTESNNQDWTISPILTSETAGLGVTIRH